jgi:2-methylcitrate dehydratase PrpD
MHGRNRSRPGRLSRRGLLQTAGWTLAAVATPWSKIGARAAGPATAVMTGLSEYMSGARSRALPPEVIEHAKHHTLDTFAAMVSGAELPPGQAAIRYARAHGGNGSATVTGSNLTAGPVDAALVNGVMAHADETDDSHSPSQSHPGCAVVPATLAAGEEFGIDGTHFLRAVALGYDVGTRVTMAMGGVTFRNESHRSTHSIAGVFGAAAGAACAAGLDAQKMRWVLDYTAQQSSGIAAWQRDTDHIEKAFVFGGMSARSGVTAALLVQLGWNGVDDIFSGPDNYFLAYAPAAEPARLVEELGERYEITQTDIKKWTVGSPIQAPLDAVETIRRRNPFDGDGVQRVVVRLAPTVAAVVDNRDLPDICLQHLIAVMLVDKTVSFGAAHDKERMRDAAVLRQRAKVDLIGDESLQRLLPVRVAVVELTLADGRRFTERVEAVRGTPRNPMSRAEVVEKCRSLVAPVLGADTSTRLIETVLAIETVTNVRALRPLLQRG